MNKKTIQYSTVEKEELKDDEVALLEEALMAKNTAYAPYSNFKVGAAILLSNNKVIRGNNQENAAYPSGLCAERVGMFAAKAQFPHESIKKMIIVAENDQGKIANAFPCGNCRQVMLEYCNNQEIPFELLMRTDGDHFLQLEDARDLLPFSFHSSTLH